jgi:hypothetical protein
LRPPACISAIDILIILFGSTSKLTPLGVIGNTLNLSPLKFLTIASSPLYLSFCLSPFNLTIHDDADGDDGDDGDGGRGDGDGLALLTIDERNGEFSTSAAAGAGAGALDAICFCFSCIAENILYNNAIKN